MRILLILLLTASPAFAAITAREAWAPPTLVGSDTGIAYITLTSDRGDAFVSAATPIAASVELHEHSTHGDVIRMRKRTSIALAQDTVVTLAPRGLHLMLYGLKQPLTDGSNFPLTLHFRDAPPITVTAVVSQQKLLDFLR